MGEQIVFFQKDKSAMKKLKWWQWALIAFVVIGVLGNLSNKNEPTTAPPSPGAAAAAGNKDQSAKSAKTSAPAVAAAPATPMSEDGETDTEFRKNGLVFLKKTMKVTKEGFGAVTGIVENRSGRQVSYAQIVFAAFDKDGNQVGSAMANVNNLADGGKWKFNAGLLVDNAASVKFTELTGF
jgi:hypothetical protein